MIPEALQKSADPANELSQRWGCNYAVISARIGLSETALRSFAMRLRRCWRDLIPAELAQTMSSGEALEEEMNALRAALSESDKYSVHFPGDYG